MLQYVWSMTWSWRRFSNSTGVFDYTIRQQMVGTDGLGKRRLGERTTLQNTSFHFKMYLKPNSRIQEHPNGFKKFNGFKSVDVYIFTRNEATTSNLCLMGSQSSKLINNAQPVNEGLTICLLFHRSQAELHVLGVCRTVCLNRWITSSKIQRLLFINYTGCSKSQYRTV